MWKKLYYKIKTNDWTAIAVWADVNHHVNVLDWMLTVPSYKYYIRTYILKQLNIIEKLWIKKRKTKSAIQLFNFIHNHRYAIIHNIIPGFAIALSNKLEEFASEDPDLFGSYKKSIFSSA